MAERTLPPGTRHQTYMDNRVVRIGALRKYISFLRQEGNRLSSILGSPQLPLQDRTVAESGLRVAVQKISIAGKELRVLERRA